MRTENLARAERAHVARLRRSLAADGYRLAKCRRGYGGYGVIEASRNFVAFGLSADTRGYDASLRDVEDWLSR